MVADIRAAVVKGACGVAELTIKGESKAIGMRTAAVKGACGVAEPAIEDEPIMAVDMHATTTMVLRQAMERPWKISLWTMELLLWKVLRHVVKASLLLRMAHWAMDLLMRMGHSRMELKGRH